MEGERVGRHKVKQKGRERLTKCILKQLIKSASKHAQFLLHRKENASTRRHVQVSKKNPASRGNQRAKTIFGFVRKNPLVAQI